MTCKTFSNIKLNKQNGLTLIELVLAIIIMSIIGTTITSFSLNSVKAYGAVEENLTALTKMRLINTRLDIELREVDHDGTNFSIDAGYDTNALLFANIDPAIPTVKFEYDGGANELKLDYADPAITILSDNVTAFTFNYYDTNGDPLTPGVDPETDIVFVEYSYDISEGNATYSSTSRVLLRDGQ